MPLASHFPVLDNRKFDDLVAEAKARIPRYTPEWTDYNPGDPGLALIEVFAWMTELLSFRMNQVPKLSYLKFLQLMGIELRPAQSATTIITFPVLPGFAATVVPLPLRSQVATGEPDAEGRPIVFETERTLTALRARLDAIQAHDGYSFSLLTEANAAMSGGFYPFGPLAKTGAALMLGFDDPGDFPSGAELALGFWPKTAIKEPPPSPCGGIDTAVPSPARIVWEAWSGTEWRAIDTMLDETLGLTRSGIVLLRTPGKGQAVKAKLGAATDKARFWLRGRLDHSAYQVPPLLLGVRANAVRASEAQTATDEILGGSDGSPDQVFALGNSPVLPDSLQLEVYETDRAEPWQAVLDFFGLKPDEAVYVPNWATGEVRFAGVAAAGSGKGGRIPSSNVDRAQNNVVARRYRFGGGIRGNVPAGALTAPLTPIDGLDPAGVTNPVAASGGADEEDIGTAMDRAPRILKARDRAVTSGDFELLAMEAGTIARAKALPLVHPEFPGMAVPGTITVVLIPELAGSLEEQLKVPSARPVESLLRTVCNYLDARRLLTTELYVVGPIYVPVTVRLVGVIAPGADAAEASQALNLAMRRFFHPIYGGSDGKGWPFGGTIRYADLYRAALDSGILRLEEVEVRRDGEPFGHCADVPITAHALIELREVMVTINEDVAEAVS
jgi:predicted phage baseplate assembly protein